ncbi:MAG: hypothetical protein EBT06_14445 [Gammaproteobacteria bacterium]|nr:hypothetical protein [Gammaproteobacteria bacterium]
MRWRSTPLADSVAGRPRSKINFAAGTDFLVANQPQQHRDHIRACIDRRLMGPPHVGQLQFYPLRCAQRPSGSAAVAGAEAALFISIGLSDDQFFVGHS